MSGGTGSGGGGGGAAFASAGATGDGGGSSAESSPRPAQTRNRGWAVNFIRESIAELRKVEWPGQSQVVQGTVVVIIACVIVGSFLYLCDQVFSKLVSRILLGQ